MNIYLSVKNFISSQQLPSIIHKKLFSYFLFSVLIIQTSFCLAQKEANTTLPARLDHVVTKFQKNRQFMGTVLVAQNDQIIFEKAYGMANLEWLVPHTIDSKFRLASVTKQFTAAAILQLDEQHKLSINDPACNYFDACPAAWKKITIKQLLSHTSGLPNYTDYSEFRTLAAQRVPETPGEILLLTKNKPLDFEPGTQWKYDNSGYIFLGVIIEKVSGEKYSNYIKKHIFEPLGMSNSGYDNAETVLYHRVSGYQPCKETLCNASYIDMSIPFSAGSLYSTVEDLYRWDRALYTNTILKKSSREHMFTAVKNNYGYGFDLSPMDHHKQIGHGGNIPGFSTYIARFAKDNIVIIVLSNVDGVDTKTIATSLTETMFGEVAYIPKKIKPMTVSPSIFKHYTGIYKTKHFLIHVNTHQGHLMISEKDMPEIEAIPISKNQFHLDRIDTFFTFTSEKNGKTVKIQLKQGNSIISGNRIEK